MLSTLEEFLKLSLKKCTENSEWSIHGLWLDYNNGTYPQHCSTMEFDTIPNDMINNMNNYWYSCDGNNHDFWNHELQKHGSCIRDFTDNTLTSTTYFNTTLALYNGLYPFVDYYCKKSIECLINFL